MMWKLSRAPGSPRHAWATGKWPRRSFFLSSKTSLQRLRIRQMSLFGWVSSSTRESRIDWRRHSGIFEGRKQDGPQNIRRLGWITGLRFFPPSFLHLRLHHWENRSFITFFEQVQAMRFAPRTEETTTLSYRHTTGEEKIERLDIATTTTPRWQPRPPAPRLHELNKVSRILRPFKNQVPTLGFPLF